MKLYIFDLDDTLLNEKKELSKYTIKVINSLKGIKVIATSRSLEHTSIYAKTLGIDNIIFSGGGGLILDKKKTYNYLNKVVVNKLIDGVKKIDPSIKICLKTKNKYLTNYYSDYSIYKDNLKAVFNNIEKITITTNKVSKVLHKLYLIDDINVCLLRSNIIMVTKKECNKYYLTKKISEYYHIKDIYAFGDDLTDYELIKNYYGIVPINAIDKVKTVSKIITLSNNDDGIAKYIDQNILGNGIKKNPISGSSATVIIDENKKLVKKMVNVNNEGVNNGYTKLFYEIKHMVNYNQNNKPIYPQIYSIKTINDTFITEMEYLYEGITVKDLLMSNVNDSIKKKIIGRIIKELFNNFYQNKDNVIPNNNYIIDNYLKRAKERIELAKKLAVDNNYDMLLNIINNGVILNNRYYSSFTEYLEMIDDNTLTNLMITNNTEDHHDLIPSNIVIDYLGIEGDIDSFKLIDPRGEIDTGINNRHYMYDMGKLLFGISGFDLLRLKNNNIYHLSYYKDDKCFNIKFNFNNNNRLVKSYFNIYDYLHCYFKENKYELFNDIKVINNYELMFKLAESICFIADIPCRIIKGDSEELAICLYLRGLETIEEFRKIGDGKNESI